MVELKTSMDRNSNTEAAHTFLSII
jgi:hypothetical protein